MRVLVAGAGFAGCVAARELADAGNDVLVVERRDHIGGNAYDYVDPAGVLVHAYGPHIFHTNSDAVFGWLSRFTDWRPYEHRVLAQVDGARYALPINRTTLNRLYGLRLTTEEDAQTYLDGVRRPRSGTPERRTSEDVVLEAVGEDLAERFFRGYTRKQWGLDLSELAASVAARIPVRVDTDDRYFTDRHQAMPLHGYTPMFERMLDHERIEVVLGCSYLAAENAWPHDQLVYTGAIDEFFGHCLGLLPYRSLHFAHQHLAGVQRFQEVGTVNYPNEHEYTRITEFRRLTGQDEFLDEGREPTGRALTGTSIVREYPCSEGDPYYPIPTEANHARYRGYERLAAAAPNVTFVGRLAQYRYYNMDQVVASALAAARTLIRTRSAAEVVA